MLRLFRRKRGRAGLRGRPEELWTALIATHAPNRTFLDVGCMWRVDGDYAFRALDAGATRVAGLDIEPATERFLARNGSGDRRVQFTQGDVNDPELPATLGTFEVVFCSGVLYHVPNPLLTLERLRALCTRTLILTTAIVPELEVPQGAVFFPGLDAATRAKLSFWSAHTKVGVDTPFEPEKGYANWFWGMSPSCVQSLLATAGFRVDESFRHRFVVTAIATPIAAASAAIASHHSRPI